ncbi:MAG: DMT family transporter [Gammaproteobacteria bacterium]
MFVRAAYLGVIIIWSTTPLAIQWSSIGGGYLFGVSARMLIGLLVLYLIFKITRSSLPIARYALKVYMVSGMGIFTSMTLVYWGAQFIPSGWVALVFGLSPIFTGVLSKLLYKKKSFSMIQLLGMICGLVGLITIFGNSDVLNSDATLGLLAVFASTITHAMSAVLIKRINAPITGVESTLGGLSVAVPLFLIAILINSDEVSLALPLHVWGAIIYLGVIATALGFSLYYFILKNMEAIKVSMITLITPVTALLLGAFLNNEPLTLSVLFGAILVVIGLGVFEFEGKLSKLLIKFTNSNSCWISK